MPDRKRRRIVLGEGYPSVDINATMIELYSWEGVVQALKMPETINPKQKYRLILEEK